MASMIYGHRGASGHAPENTLEAFKMAFDMGAEGVELDVHLSKDGELIVIHDETVDRTTDGKGTVADMSLKQLKALSAHNGMEQYRGVKIPTLQEVYELIKGTDKVINVEIKTDERLYPGIEEKCLQAAREQGVEGQILYSSFNHDTLKNLKALDPTVKTGALYSKAISKVWDYVKQRGIEYIHPQWGNLFIPGLIHACKHNGIGINPWTVNKAWVMKHCLRHGIGIITNYPDVALKLRKEMEQDNN